MKGETAVSMPVISGSSINRCQAISDIIDSVAYQQTALSHILNAEGEKLQAIIGTPGVTTALLLATNASVQGVVDAIAGLESTLQAKLGLFNDVLGSECTIV